MIQKRKPRKASNAWLTTFADLTSLMITFFVLLFSMKDVDVKKWQEISGSLSGSLTFTPVEQVKYEANQTDKATFAQADRLTYLQAVLERRFNEDDVLRNATLIHNQQQKTLTIIVPNRLLFDVAAADLNAAGEEAIGTLGSLLQHLDNAIVVGGHSDPSPIRGSARYETNWELSMMRALGVLKKLRASGVVAPMKALGFADSRFHMINSELSKTERYRAARRVEIVIESKASTEKSF